MKLNVKGIVVGVLVVSMISNIFMGCSISKQEEVDAKNKVHFEGIGDVVGQSESEIVDAINANETEKTRLIIELDNSYEKIMSVLLKMSV